MRTIFSTLVLVFCFGSLSHAAESIDVGPAVGSKIPSDFTARDAKGNTVSYGDVSGEKGLVLAFVRSAS